MKVIFVNVNYLGSAKNYVHDIVRKMLSFNKRVASNYNHPVDNLEYIS